MNSIISVNNLKKVFKDCIALKDVSFNVQEGEIFGFLGPSGAGKTTTIKILTSQLLPTCGDTKVFGKDVYLNKKDIYSNIGVITDNNGMYERLSVYDNLKLFADINGVSYDHINDVLKKVGLLSEVKKETKKLSKGMKQRLILARALLHKPKLLFLDEPTSSLDPRNVLEIHKLLLELNQEGTTIFLTTHNMEEANKLCHRVAFLNEGEIVEIGNPEELKIKYSNNTIKVLLKDQIYHSVNNDKDGAMKINKWMNEGNVLTIHTQEPNLEQIFLQLTGRNL